MKPAMLYDREKENKICCRLCRHECRISEKKTGVCGVRQNLNGDLYTHAYGKAVTARADPIEKKPLYHFLPGGSAYSVATMGCNFKCGFCQNWQISQPGEQERLDMPGAPLTPEEIVKNARINQCTSIAYTYTEPTIFFEYAYDTARMANAQGMKNIFVTNGYMSVEALKTIAPFLDACNVDLKAFDEAFYENICKARLQPVLDNIRLMRELKIWIEITTLIVPGKNDDEDGLRKTARFIVDTDPDIPWHISRFHPDYKYADTAATPASVLNKAYTIGKKAGLRYIYMGNLLDAKRLTQCPHCLHPVIDRGEFPVVTRLTENKRCPRCGDPVAGVYA